MLAHIALIGLGYAGPDSRGYSGLLGELWNLTWNLPGMLLAVAGTLCLVLVVVTSVRAARRRLRYESWHLLHLYAYLGVGLALPHQLWTGADFLANPLPTAYWWTAWACRPSFPSHRGVVSVHLAGRHLDEFRARAGQFLLLRFLGAPGASRAHPYSLSAAPNRSPAAGHGQGPGRRQPAGRPAASRYRHHRAARLPEPRARLGQ